MTPEELKDWLEARPEETRVQEAVWISSRAAARVLPVVFQHPYERGRSDWDSLQTCRCLVISIASASSGPERFQTVALAAVREFEVALAADLASEFALETVIAHPSEVTNKCASAVNAFAVAFGGLPPVGNTLAADSAFLEANGIPKTSPPLWPDDVPEKIAVLWQEAKTRLTNDPTADWSFWIDWYQALLAGTPQNLDMLTEIALIAPEDWDKGPAHVNAIIGGIVARYGPATGLNFEDILGATLTDFRFDQLAHVMRAVPVADDWKHLTDPARLQAFLADAQDLIDSLQLLAAAFHAEGTAMQGAGATQTYLDAVRTELARAKATDLLRVDKLIEFGRILERMAAREDTRREFGALAEPLEECLQKLRDLVRRHFAQVLARMAPLRELGMEEDVNQWEVIAEFRAIIAGVRSGAEGALPPLVAEDVAVLDDLLDSVEARLRDLEAATGADTKSSLQREINFQLAKIGASVSLYLERAKPVAGESGKAIDAAMKWEKRVTGIAKLAKWLKDVFDGGPPS